jgi:hypothetical protein
MALFRIPKITWNANTLEFGYPMDAAVSWPEPVEGSVLVAAPSGARDGWIVRDEPRLAGTVRWIPSANITTTGYAPFTGWDGAAGWAAFLSYVRLGNSFAFFPDRTLGTSITSYLVSPFQGEPGQGGDGTRALRLVIASSSSTEYTGY